MRKGFTLIELLVVVGIIAVLISLLLPALGHARRTSRATAGTANLRSLTQVLMVYTNTNREALPNPFRAEWKELGVDCPKFYDVVSTRTKGVVWSFQSARPEWTTEFFAYYWYSKLAEDDETLAWRDEQFSPADGHLMSLRNTLGTRRETYEGLMLWPTSFLYSPTFWSSPSRYPCGSRLDMKPSTVRTTTLAMVSSPAAKVLLFERMDFEQADRIRADAAGGTSRQRIPPAWNNIRARTAISLVDGSVDEVQMRAVYERARSNQDFQPSGTFAAFDSPPLCPPSGRNTSFPTGGGSGADGEYPLFFWATQGGVEGRDIAR